MTAIRSITRIEPAQFALIMGTTYVFIGLIIAVLAFLAMSLAHTTTFAAFGGLGRGMAVIVVPIVYGIIGYICGFIGAAIYNVVAGTVGGIKVTVSE
jgi:hypothetical protein